jgi:hypothetical protein
VTTSFVRLMKVVRGVFVKHSVKRVCDEAKAILCLRQLYAYTHTYIHTHTYTPQSPLPRRTRTHSRGPPPTRTYTRAQRESSTPTKITLAGQTCRANANHSCSVTANEPYICTSTWASVKHSRLYTHIMSRCQPLV